MFSINCVCEVINIDHVPPDNNHPLPFPSSNPQRLSLALPPRLHGRQHVVRNTFPSGDHERSVQGKDATGKTPDGVWIVEGGDESAGRDSCAAVEDEDEGGGGEGGGEEWEEGGGRRIECGS